MEWRIDGELPRCGGASLQDDLPVFETRLRRQLDGEEDHPNLVSFFETHECQVSRIQDYHGLLTDQLTVRRNWTSVAIRAFPCIFTRYSLVQHSVHRLVQGYICRRVVAVLTQTARSTLAPHWS